MTLAVVNVTILLMQLCVWLFLSWLLEKVGVVV